MAVDLQVILMRLETSVCTLLWRPRKLRIEMCDGETIEKVTPKEFSLQTVWKALGEYLPLGKYDGTFNDFCEVIDRIPERSLYLECTSTAGAVELFMRKPKYFLLVEGRLNVKPRTDLDCLLWDATVCGSPICIFKVTFPV